MAALACCRRRELARRRAVLVGGLGLGFTLTRRCSSFSQRTRRSSSASWSNAIVAWNADRCRIGTGELWPTAAYAFTKEISVDYVSSAMAPSTPFSVDIDNGPEGAHVADELAAGTATRGYAPLHHALVSGGIVVIWSGVRQARSSRSACARADSTVPAHAVHARGPIAQERRHPHALRGHARSSVTREGRSRDDFRSADR